MLPELKLVISSNNKVIETVTKGLNEQGLVKSIEDFQVTANATMTKMIQASEDAGGCLEDEKPSDSDDDDEENISVSPKRRKK